jgi:hypothetical protein
LPAPLHARILVGMRLTRRFTVSWCVAFGCMLATGVSIASPAAATTRFASAAGRSTPSTCTDPASACSLPTALASAGQRDTVSLANGRYDVAAVTLPSLPLSWVATDEQTRPILTSAAAAPTLNLTAAQSGSSFEHLEIDNTNTAAGKGQPALQLAAGVAATISSSVVSGGRCIEALDAGPLTIEDSTLSTTGGIYCARLGPMSRLERSTVGSERPLTGAAPPPMLVSDGVVEDTAISGTLALGAPSAIARRVRATGSTAIIGEGLVVDSLAKGNGTDGAAIEASAPRGGTLTVVNSTAVSSTEPALLSAPVISPTGPVVPNVLDVSNSIARGRTVDIRATGGVTCLPGNTCAGGRITIDHSDFGTRVPAATAANAAVITEGPGNLAGDPLFTDAADDDYHLHPSSPAIDAGAANPLALPSDLNGLPRLQGSAPDLGAFESVPPPPPPWGTGGPTGPGEHTGGGGSTPHKPATLTGLRVTPSRFHIGGRSGGTTIRFRLDAASSVTLSFTRRPSPHRPAGAAARLVIPRGRAGVNVVRFSGVLGRRALPAAGYQLVAAPPHGRARLARFTVMSRPRRHNR